MPTGKHRRPSTTDLPSSNVHPALVTRVCRDRAAPADLEDLEDRAALVDLGLVGQEAQAGRADLAAPVAPVAPADTNPAALGVMADTGLADREGPANPVDLVDRVDLEDR